LTGVDAVASKLHHPALTVKPYLGALPHVRKFYQVVGMGLRNNYLVHNSSLVNLVRGVLTRVLLVKGKPTPKPRDGIYMERLRYFRNFLFKGFSSTTPIDRQSFVDYYQGRRRTLYQNAVDSLLTKSICRRDAHIRAFVKAEFINSDEKPDPDPRVISPRDPRYNVEVGRYLRPIEHHLYTMVDRIFGDKTILKGLNAQQMGSVFKEKWNHYRNPVAIGLDASRFDQHVSVQALEWEHSIYQGIYKSPELQRLLSWQLKNIVVGYCKDGKIKYQTNGCRMSGDMNTSLGNCLIMCALVHAYLKHRCINASLANNGDDCVVIMESKDVTKFSRGLVEWFLEMGFNMKVEMPVYDIEKIEFCQTHPVFDGHGYVMVRNFPKSISKDCLSLKQLDSPLVCRSWLNAVGQGGLSLTGGIPVYQDFYSTLIQISETVDGSRSRQSSKRRHNVPDADLCGGLEWLSHGMQKKYQSISPEVRHSFYLAFGTTPDEQILMENSYRGLAWSYRIENLHQLAHW
jgi:hypothetical protein